MSTSIDPATVDVVLDALRELAPLRRALARQVDNDLPPGALSTLMFLADHDGVGVSELATRLGSDMGVVSRQVAYLERRGLVTRMPSDHDRRAHRLGVSAQAVDLIADVRSKIVDRLSPVVGEWSRMDAEHLLRLLSSLRAGIECDQC